MQQLHVRCPGCQKILAVPPGSVSRFVRCGQCGTRFQVLDSRRVADDTIVTWLLDGREEDDFDAAESPDGVKLDQAATATLTHAEEEDADGKPRVPREPIRLVQASTRGALFEFPAQRLLDPSFRCAMPRRCLHCGARAHLHAHVIVFSHLSAEISMRDEHAVAELAVKDPEVASLSAVELLRHLPKVPNVPYPGNKPMPYWICDLCSPSGALAGEIHVNSESGEGWCRLLICNLRRAEEFLIAAGGQGTEGHNALRTIIERTTETPWERLPLVVRHRIEQWFHPTQGEHFLVYVPDRDHARTEDGVAGVVVSNLRLTHHTPYRHHEATSHDPLELRLSRGKGKQTLEIRGPGWRVRHMTVEEEGVRRLHGAVLAARFKAHWR